MLVTDRGGCDPRSTERANNGAIRRLLSKAVEARDPVVRLQWTVAWFVAGLQHVFQVGDLAQLCV